MTYYNVKVVLNSMSLKQRLIKMSLARHLAYTEAPNDDSLTFGFHTYHEALNFFDEVTALKTWFKDFSIFKPIAVRGFHDAEPVEQTAQC